MEKFNNLLKELNDLNIIQKQIDWAENIPDEIWKNHFIGNYQNLISNLNVDQRRHYETSISVIEIYGKLMGIRHITMVYSEQSEVYDCSVTLKFLEMESITITSYKIKQ